MVRGEGALAVGRERHRVRVLRHIDPAGGCFVTGGEDFHPAATVDGTQSRPSGATARSYGCTPVSKYLITRRVAASTTATPLPLRSSSYMET